MFGRLVALGFRCPGRSDDPVADCPGAPRARCPRRGAESGGDRLRATRRKSSRCFESSSKDTGPDLVLFYDGVNDTMSALLESQPTVTTNETNRVREFNILQSPPQAGRRHWLVTSIQNSATYRLAAALGRRSGLGQARKPTGPAGAALGRSRGGRCPRLPGQPRDRSSSRERSTDSVPLFVWQPDVFTKPNLVPFEVEEKAKAGAGPARCSRRSTGGLERAESAGFGPGFCQPERFLLRRTASLQYLDFCHTTEEANARIAALLVGKLTEIAGKSRKEQRSWRHWKPWYHRFDWARWSQRQSQMQRA